MKKLGIILAILLIPSTVLAITWFNISGTWTMGDGTPVQLIQGGNTIAVKFPGGITTRGTIEQRPIAQFRVTTKHNEDFEGCTMYYEFDFGGEKTDEGLSVVSCRRKLWAYCPDERGGGTISEDYDCAGLWTR